VGHQASTLRVTEDPQDAAVANQAPEVVNSAVILMLLLLLVVVVFLLLETGRGRPPTADPPPIDQPTRVASPAAENPVLVASEGEKRGYVAEVLQSAAALVVLVLLPNPQSSVQEVIMQRE